MPELPVQPTGYRILIRPLKITEQTPSGIYKPEVARKLEENATIVGEVLALGPLAYLDEEKFPGGPWCKPGDFIIMRAYAGTKFKHQGADYRLINDDTVEGITNQPEAIERAA
jgi:co-chaperonin GroES (HSP10)